MDAQAVNNVTHRLITQGLIILDMIYWTNQPADQPEGNTPLQRKYPESQGNYPLRDHTDQICAQTRDKSLYQWKKPTLERPPTFFILVPLHLVHQWGFSAEDDFVALPNLFLLMGFLGLGRFQKSGSVDGAWWIENVGHWPLTWAQQSGCIMNWPE